MITGVQGGSVSSYFKGGLEFSFLSFPSPLTRTVTTRPVNRQDPCTHPGVEWNDERRGAPQYSYGPKPHPDFPLVFK